MTREALLIQTFVELADALVDEFDVVDLLTRLTLRCVEVLDVDAAGIMIAGPNGDLRVVASSSEAMRMLELFELQSAEGPCPECFRTGTAIVEERLARDDRWPRFAPRASAAGFSSVHAIPMRHLGQVIGALNLFRTSEGFLGDEDIVAAQAFADVATIAVLQHRAIAKAHAVNEQLASALNSRIVIEQAKGMVAQRTGRSVEEAFALLRTHARSHNLLLADVARSIIDGSRSSASLDSGS